VGGLGLSFAPLGNIADIVQECRHCRKQIAPLRSDCAVSAARLQPDDKPFLGDAQVDTPSGIQVVLRRIEALAVTVITYVLPGR
jgi:hypothetical protein